MTQRVDFERMLITCLHNVRPISLDCQDLTQHNQEIAQ